jgi:hypothetical protein
MLPVYFNCIQYFELISSVLSLCSLLYSIPVFYIKWWVIELAAAAVEDGQHRCGQQGSALQGANDPDIAQVKHAFRVQFLFNAVPGDRCGPLPKYGSRKRRILQNVIIIHLNFNIDQCCGSGTGTGIQPLFWPSRSGILNIFSRIRTRWHKNTKMC